MARRNGRGAADVRKKAPDPLPGPRTYTVLRVGWFISDARKHHQTMLKAMLCRGRMLGMGACREVMKCSGESSSV